MSSRFAVSTDETFFNGTISDVIKTQKDEFVNSTVISLGKENKKPKGKKSLAPNKPKIKNTNEDGSNNENAGAKNAGEKKRGRPSAKRAVLKELNNNSSAKNPIAKRRPSPSILKEAKETELPKIVIYEDNRSGGKKRQEGRKSAQAQRSPVLAESPRRKSARQSAKETTSKSPKKEKSEKSPAKGRSSKTDLDIESVLTKLEIVFPNVDPEYIKAQFLKFKGSVSETIDYIILKEKTNELPTKADYEKRQETERQQRKYLENFSIENFLKTFPDPWEYFLKQERQNCAKYAEHSFFYLKNKFKKHSTQAIRTTLMKNGYSLYRTNKELQKKNRLMKMRATNRSKAECDSGKPATYNEEFMHEMVFIQTEAKIKAYVKKTETARHKKFKQAKQAGTLLECLICNDPSLLLDDAVNCPANHVFCKDCVVKSVTVEMDKNNFRFKCLVKCEEMFSMESLQRVLTSETIERIQSRNQHEEIKAAEIKNLVWCPFCCYAIIMPPELSVLSCLNPDCLKESCRHCGQPNHIPLKCYELENFDKSILDQDGVEDEKKSPNLSLICISCNKEFLETDESNKLVCPCGATICSICRQPTPECPHHKDESAEHGPKEVSSNSNCTDDTDASDDVSGSPDSKVFDFNENLADFYPVAFHSF